MQYDSSNYTGLPEDEFDISNYNLARSGVATNESLPDIYYQVMSHHGISNTYTVINTTLWMLPLPNVTEFIANIVNPYSIYENYTFSV